MDYKNMFSLEGRKAVITGGCGYLGREIVKGMVDFGADVYVIDYKISEIEDISEPSRIHYISATRAGSTIYHAIWATQRPSRPR